jgi:hypothetical protein
MKKTILNLTVVCFLGASLSSCKKNSESLPPIGGFNNANEVASSNLVAYVPLDGSAVETKSKATAASISGISYVTGVKGQAAKFANGYAVFPESTSITTGMTSFTISSWIQVQNNGNTATMFVQLGRAGEWAGTINMMAETGQFKATSDTLRLKGLLVENRGGNANWQDCINRVDVDPASTTDVLFPNKVAGTSWFHGLVRYDAATSKFTAWSNGVKISNPTWELRQVNGANMGNITPYSPSKLVLGGFLAKITGASTDSWQGNLTGQLDEVRIYNKALTDAEISALYQLEKAGR